MGSGRLQFDIDWTPRTTTAELTSWELPSLVIESDRVRANDETVVETDEDVNRFAARLE